MAKDQTTPEPDEPEDGEIDVGELKAETLMVDIRDAMLMQFRDKKRPWPLLTEDEQRGVANSFELAAKNLVRKTVRMLTAFEFEHVVVTLGEMKAKPGKDLEAKITCSNIKENRDILGDYGGTLVTIYMVDSETFMAERAAPITPDQGSMLPPEEEAA